MTSGKKPFAASRPLITTVYSSTVLEPTDDILLFIFRLPASSKSPISMHEFPMSAAKSISVVPSAMIMI